MYHMYLYHTAHKTGHTVPRTKPTNEIEKDDENVSNHSICMSIVVVIIVGELPCLYAQNMQEIENVE